MKFARDQVTDVFYFVDEFCQEFSKSFERYQIGNTPKKHPRTSDSEVITILVLFHLGAFRNAKHFYIHAVQKHLQEDFPQTVCTTVLLS
jgi:hypothetical protein